MVPEHQFRSHNGSVLGHSGDPQSGRCWNTPESSVLMGLRAAGGFNGQTPHVPPRAGENLESRGTSECIPGLSDMETDRPFEIVNLRKKCAWGTFFPQIDDCQRSVCHEHLAPLSAMGGSRLLTGSSSLLGACSAMLGDCSQIMEQILRDVGCWASKFWVFGTRSWVFGTGSWVFGTQCWVFGTRSWVFRSAVGEIPTWCTPPFGS